MLDQPPIISFLDIEANQDSALAHIDNALSNWGCFYLTDHGLDDLIPRLFKEMRTLFQLSTEIKLEYERTLDNPFGFFDQEITKNKIDKKEIFDIGNNRAATKDKLNQWPKMLPQLEETSNLYFQSCEKICFKLLEAIAQNLETDSQTLSDMHGPKHDSFLRLNYLPIDHAKHGLIIPSVTSINHHTDAGTLTLLLNDSLSGLQCLQDEKWVDIPYIQGALIVNAGDMLQILSNKRYKALVHRVMGIYEQDRYSVPFFFNPHENTIIKPFDNLVENQESFYQPLSWQAFRKERYIGDYVDQGEEIQIHHFQTPPKGE